jgi:predicted transcriptional regulator
MTKLLSATEVRKEWSKFVDEVVWIKPAFVKRKHDIVAVISLDMLESILEEYNLTVSVFQEEDKSYTGVCSEIDLMVNATDTEMLRTKIAVEILEYSEEYINDFKLYYSSLNRKKHFPYVYRAFAAGGDLEKIKKMFIFKNNPQKKG